MPGQKTLVRVDYPGGSIESRLVALGLRATVKPLLQAWARVPYLPWPLGVVDHVGRVLRSAEGVSYSHVRLPNCSAELVTPPAVTSGRFVLYLHGGGFQIGGHYLHRNMVGRFAGQLGAPLLHVNYRKIPRHSVADAMSDCVDAYKYVLGLGIDPARIIIMGDSSGGYFTFTTALAIRDTGLPLPGALVSIAPLTDFDVAAKISSASARTCAVVPRSAMSVLPRLALRSGRGAALVSPAHCRLSGLPPTLIQVSSAEMLYPDAVLMADRLAAAGVPTELHVWDGQVHVFQAAAGVVPEAAHAVAEAVRFVDRAVPPVEERVA